MRDLVRLPKPLIVLIVTFLILWLFLSSEQYPAWDAAYYYGYTRSAVFDGDLKLENDLLLSYSSASNEFQESALHEELTATGRVATPFAIGSALIWLPWFATLRGLAFFGQWLSVLPENLSGFEWYFRLPISTLSSFLGLGAFWIAFIISRAESKYFSALAAAVTFTVSTPLLYYQFREPLYSHTASALVNGIVVLLWWRSYRQSPKPREAVIIGSVIGFATLIRWQNISYVILPLTSASLWLVTTQAGERIKRWKNTIFYIILVLLSTSAILTLQLSHWRIVYGKWVTVPQGNAYVDWSAPFLTEVLFSPLRGVLPWMPAAFLAVLGLIFLARKNPRFILPLITLLVIAIYINSSTRDWFGGGGYGPRRFSSELVIFVIGYSGLISAIPGIAQKASALIFGVTLSLHQLILYRFALEEQIGGRILNLYPEYRWIEQSYDEFITSLVGHLQDVISSPRNFFVHTGSPFSKLSNGQWPGDQLYSLILTAIFSFVCIQSVRLLIKRRLQPRNVFSTISVGAILLIILANVWILAWA